MPLSSSLELRDPAGLLLPSSSASSSGVSPLTHGPLLRCASRLAGAGSTGPAAGAPPPPPPLSGLCGSSLLSSSTSSAAWTYAASGRSSAGAGLLASRSGAPLSGCAENGGINESWGFLETAGGFCLTGELWRLRGGLEKDGWGSTASPPLDKWSSGSPFGVSSAAPPRKETSFNPDEADHLHDLSSGGLFDRGKTVGGSQDWPSGS